MVDDCYYDLVMCMRLLWYGKELYKHMVAPRSSPIAASVTTKINNVTRFVRQCKLKQIIQLKVQ